MPDQDYLEAAWDDYLRKIPAHALGSHMLGLMRFAFFVGAAYSARYILGGIDPEVLAKQADTKADAEIARNKGDSRRVN